MAEQSTEERFSALEREVADLKQQLTHMLAERRSFDDLRTEIKNVGRMVTEFSEREHGHERYVQARFGVVDYDLKGIDSDIKALQGDITEVKNDLKEVKLGTQNLAAGQQQIIEMLLGKPRRND